MSRFVEFINTGNEKLAEELIARRDIPRAGASRTPARPGWLPCRDRGGFPDTQWTLEETIAEDDKVAARFTMRGTHEGSFFGVPPTGKSFQFKP